MLLHEEEHIFEYIFLIKLVKSFCTVTGSTFRNNVARFGEKGCKYKLFLILTTYDD